MSETQDGAAVERREESRRSVLVIGAEHLLGSEDSPTGLYRRITYCAYAWAFGNPQVMNSNNKGYDIALAALLNKGGKPFLNASVLIADLRADIPTVINNLRLYVMYCEENGVSPNVIAIGHPRFKLPEDLRPVSIGNGDTFFSIEHTSDDYTVKGVFNGLCKIVEYHKYLAKRAAKEAERNSSHQDPPPPLDKAS